MEEVITKKIKEIKFSLLGPEQIKKIGVAKIVTPELYDMDGYPVDGGLMDLRLGAIDPGVRCRTCGRKLTSCPGHFGFIELARPAIHIKYVSIVELFLRTTCGECGKILLDEETIQKTKSIKLIIKKAKDRKTCPHCGKKQEKIKIEKPTTFYLGKKRLFPNEIRERMVRIPDSELKIFGLDPKSFRPEWGILTLLLVPPVTIRPSITLNTGERSEDDTTHKLGDIVRANQRLWENLNAGAPEVIIEDLWDLLQYHVTTFFDNNVSQVPPARHRSGHPLKTISERIKGKEGHIRHNLAGKRVDFSSRTVISPDPFLKLEEVGVPEVIAKVLTSREKVNDNNIEFLKKLIMKGDNYPGAAYIIRPDGKRKKITEDTKEEIINELTKGYVVDRHIIDGDIVLFNRHPSLHRLSLMAHHVKVLPYRTFRLHPAVTFPYNADFDGDEMNIHVPQTEEAKAEAEVLLEIRNHLTTAKNNTNVYGCIEDSVTGLYLLTKHAELPKEDALQLLFECGIELEKIEKLKFKKNVNGVEIFSALLPKNINFTAKNKAGDVIVSIKDGEIIKGLINNKVVGVEGSDEESLVKYLDREYGREETIKILKNIFTLGLVYLSKIGFTISIKDVQLKDEILDYTKTTIESAEKKVEELIDEFNKGQLELIPGKNSEESREIKILQALNNIRAKLGEYVEKEIDKENSAGTMVHSGSRGNMLYITQMGCSVGQQALWAKRIDFGFSGRTLSLYQKGDISPRARGFVKSSYLSGLKPDEFFFTAITGRDGLMDTALRTPKSGYLYRRLSNALQDLRIEYDGTVRDANGTIMQFVYGNDGVDVSLSHLKNNKIAAGEAIGIVTAQSFGESATQMTLNVFHFAGVSEMQITLGLPRLIEIFDARKNPSTPSIEIYLDDKHNNKNDARRIAELIKETTINDITSEIKIDFSEKKVLIEFDKSLLKDLKLDIKDIKDKIADKNLKVRARETGVTIDLDESDYKDIYKIKERIKVLIISGVKKIKQILPVQRGKDFVILTAGSNLKDILEVKGVDKEKTISNDIHEVSKIFGIETAREVIINEVLKVIKQQGFDIDRRHIELIADVMTSSGEVKGVTRIGIISNKSSVLARASFETPIKHFVNASLRGGKDRLISVIENIMFNQAVPVGTGLPGLLLEITHGRKSKEKTKS